MRVIEVIARMMMACSAATFCGDGMYDMACFLGSTAKTEPRRSWALWTLGVAEEGRLQTKRRERRYHLKSQNGDDTKPWCAMMGPVTYGVRARQVLLTVSL